MQKANRLQGKWRSVIFGCIGLLVVLADQISKGWIRDNLEPGHSLFDIGFFRIIYIYNTGGAFGIFRDHSFVLAVAALIGIIVILVLAFVLRDSWPFLDSTLAMSAIGLVMGGTMGNLIDRLRLGHVTDFIDFKVWPAFNIADMSVTVGIIIIAWRLIFLTQPAKR